MIFKCKMCGGDVTPIKDTQILQIKYQNKSPEVAKSILENITILC